MRTYNPRDPKLLLLALLNVEGAGVYIHDRFVLEAVNFLPACEKARFVSSRNRWSRCCKRRRNGPEGDMRQGARFFCCFQNLASLVQKSKARLIQYMEPKKKNHLVSIQNRAERYRPS